MNKVISVNLNGKAYQLEEKGYEALDAYLKKARLQLAGNPDLQEILTDLEQAIADKCNRFLRSGKTVVLSSEVDRIIEEMGPVRDIKEEADDAAGDADQASGDEKTSNENTGQEASARAPRKLYRLKDDRMVEGICSGLAAYLGIDPTIVRIIFVVLLIVTTGTAAIAYLVLALIIPEAKTPEEHAAAHGAPFDARDVIERAKNKFQDFQDSAYKSQNRKANAEYWRSEDRKKLNSGISTLLTVLFFIIGAVVILKFLNWVLSPHFVYSFGIHTYPAWISIIVLLVLIYVLTKVVRNISSPNNGTNTLLAGILKFCLFVLVVMFAVRMFPFVGWVFEQMWYLMRHATFWIQQIFQEIWNLI